MSAHDFILFCLKIVGLHPTERSFLSKVLVAFCVFNTALIAIAYFYGLYNAQGALVFTSKAEGFVAELHLINRLFNLSYNRSKLSKIISDASSFWQTSKFPEKHAQITRTKKLISNFEWIYIANCGIIFAYTAIAPLISRNYTISAFSTWLPDNETTAAIFFWDQMVVIGMLVLLVIGHDLLFVNLISELVFQTQLLEYGLKEMSDERDFGDEKIREYLNYHEFLLRNGQDLADALEGFFLGHFVIVIITICVELTMVVDNLDDIGFVIRSVQYLLAIVTQKCLLSFSAAAATEGLSGLREAFFSCGWYSRYSPKIWYAIKFGMMRSNKPVRFTVGKIIVVNREYVTFIVKTGISFFTLLLTVRNK